MLIAGEATANKRHGNQEGDPAKGAAAMYEFAIMPDPPLRVVIGSDAYKDIMKKIEVCEGCFVLSYSLWLWWVDI